ncbi:MAG: translocation/assembly module TamB, partial [Comamonadaceae bacterium]
MNVATSETTRPEAPPRRPLWRRIARVLLWGIAVLLALLLVLAGGAWWWTGSDQSLALVLNRAARYLPADQLLETRDVHGSVRGGGRIGWIRYSSPTLKVEASDVEVGWQLRPLLQRKLQLGELRARQVLLTPIEPAVKPPDEPRQPLDQVTLPIDIDLPFRIGELRWAGPPVVSATGLAGRYRYDDEHHRLKIDGVDLADGHYDAELTLQGPAPMALEMAVNGRVQAPVPEGIAPIAVLARARAEGTLSGEAARLRIHAELDPQEAAAGAEAMRARVDAEIAPWAQQPVVSALADLANVDAARLWPTAPGTLLSGTVKVGPVAPGAGSAATVPAPAPAPGIAPAPGTAPAPATVWQADIDLRNARPGPWDRQRLPLDRIEARLRYDGRGLQVPSATIALGGGRIDAEGGWAPAPDPWNARLRLRGVSPAALYSELDATAIDGTADASQQGEAIVFDLALKARETPAGARRSQALGGFRVDQASATGRWEADTLTLGKLSVTAERAR